MAAAATAEEQAQRLALQLGSDADARRRACIELESDGGAEAVQTLIVCDALVQHVLCGSLDAAEHEEAGLMIARIMMRSKLSLIELIRDGKFVQDWQTPGAAMASIYAKEAEALTSADVMVTASTSYYFTIVMAKGFTDQCAAAGTSELELVSKVPTQQPWVTAGQRPGGEQINERMILLALDIIRDVGSGKLELSDLQLGAVWSVAFWNLTQRPAMAAVAARAGMFELGMALIKRCPAAELATWRTETGLLVSIVLLAFAHITILQPNLGLQRVISSGAAEASVAVFKSFWKAGASPEAIEDANVCSILHATLFLHPLDLTQPEAEPIVAMFQGIPAPLRFVLEHSLAHIGAVGMTTSGMTTSMCAMLFGKAEEGESLFGSFSQSLIDDALLVQKDMFDGNLVGFFPEVPTNYLKPILHLCISDTNKVMLTQSEHLMPLLMTTLYLLPADHPRYNTDAATKAAIQTDATICFLQISVCEAGRGLLENDHAALEALHALADGGQALTEEGKAAAHGALIAIEGVTREPEPAQEGGAEAASHIMLSYQ